MAQIIDGKKISQQIKDEVKEEVSRLKEEGVEVVYLPRTPEISSTQIKQDLHK